MRKNRDLEATAKEIDKAAKPAHPLCKRFRHTCWLPYPQPNCGDCRFLDVFALKRERRSNDEHN